MLAHLTLRPPVLQALPGPVATAPGRAAAQVGPRPVAEPKLAMALSQPEVSRGAERQLQTPSPSSAEAAAEAARRAYIRASIAAGINPLPLPGL